MAQRGVMEGLKKLAAKPLEDMYRNLNRDEDWEGGRKTLEVLGKFREIRRAAEVK